MSHFTHGVVDVWCGGCLVWWMSFFTYGVVDVWCGGCLVWWMSGVVDVWCGGCPILHMVWWMSGVVDVWCGGCLILHTVWWMSGVVDVCVVDVVQSVLGIPHLFPSRMTRNVRPWGRRRVDFTEGPSSG